MKTRFIIMMLACAAMFGFSSCSEDDEETVVVDVNEIIGTWETYDSPDVVLVWTFNKNGMCIQRADLYSGGILLYSKKGKEQKYEYHKYYVLIDGKRHDCTINGNNMRISDGAGDYLEMKKTR